MFVYRCWLNGPYIWAFIGPVILILAVREFCLFIILDPKYQMFYVTEADLTKLVVKIIIIFCKLHKGVSSFSIRKQIKEQPT